MRRCLQAILAGTILAPAAALAAPADEGLAPGQVVETRTGCVSPEPYAIFERVYSKDGRVAAYKALVETKKCQRLPGPMPVKLEETVERFDYGWGKGRVWRVSPVEADAKAPRMFFIRSRVKK